MENASDRLFGSTFEETSVGSVFESGGRTITETDVVNFAMLSGDWYPLHTDAEYAGASMFGRRIGHGFLTLSAMSGFVPMRPGDLEAFYGMDDVRFTRPVFFDDTIRARFEVVDKSEIRPGLGKLTVAVEVRNQRDEVVVEAKLLFAQRMAGAG